jgi:hypothetical protein
MVETAINTKQTMVAFTPVYFSSLFPTQSDGFFGAGFHAGPASFAVDVTDDEVRKKILRFRIGTPETLQGTALHKYCCSYARSVMDTEPLDIKNEPFAALFGNHHDSAWSVLVFYYAREVAFLLERLPPPACQVIFCL